ncbi:hypothetical protein BDZ89DRAFT_1078985 [Hymenopellis radicata]|nr:hypothetical protein BDZ89DRAFT_1078985 [Hymenopellis radicata]
MVAALAVVPSVLDGLLAVLVVTLGVLVLAGLAAVRVGPVVVLAVLLVGVIVVLTVSLNRFEHVGFEVAMKVLNLRWRRIRKGQHTITPNSSTCPTLAY